MKHGCTAVPSGSAPVDSDHLVTRLRELAKDIEQQSADLAAWLALMPRCRWQDDHGCPQTCERPATRSDCGARGDYFACDECSAGDGPHEYQDLPYAELVRKVSGIKTGSEARR
jgi:hypothetical protein